jgi:two-component system CheB/CheR fusion protein
VVVELPLASAPAQTPAARAALPTSQRRVLVIDDNPDAAESLAAVLAISGHDVKTANDGISGIAHARRFEPEIVICDIGLPGMDGYAVARAFRADPALARTYLIAISGYARDTDVQHAIAAGFDQHLAKPPDLPTLYRLVHETPADRREPNPQP